MNNYKTEKLLIQLGSIFSLIGGIFVVIFGLLTSFAIFIHPLTAIIVIILCIFFVVLGIVMVIVSIISLVMLGIFKSREQRTLKTYAIANIVLGIILGNILILIGGILLNINVKKKLQ